jgi:hypothetical protein
MIFSPSHNLLILKNYKVGGTSLELDLQKVLPINCIVTPPEPPSIKIDDFRYRNYQEYGFTSHSSFNYFKIKLPEAAKKVTSVVFIRNPFDTILSHFCMILKLRDIKQEDYKKHVDMYFENMLESTKYIYSNSGEIQVSYVFKYENGIESQINSVLSKVKAPNIKLTSREKEWRPKGLLPTEVFSKAQLDLIRKEWYWEIEKFYPECL